MSVTLSPYRLGKARATFGSYNVLNVISWNFLVGNILTLFALRLNASATYIGLLNAILYVAFFFLPLGRLLTRRFSIIRIFSTAWTARSIGMIPVLAAPFMASAGHEEIALGLVLLGVSIFHITRGIGMVGNNPVVGFLASGSDRGSYLTQIQITNNGIAMLAGFIIAMLLGRDPPLFLYTIIFAVGIGSGIASGFFLRKVPEPPVVVGGEKVKFITIVRQAISTPSLRQFLVILLLVALVSGVSRIFLTVYSREIFQQSDGNVSLYAVFAGFGILIIGLLIKFLVDRIGAKPLFILCVIIGLVSIVPIIFISPGQAQGTVFIYLALLYFVMHFGFSGSEGIAQTYFFGLVPQERMLDMGILYFLCFGIAGTTGSFLGGLFLDSLRNMGLSSLFAFRTLYGIMLGLGVVILILQRKMVPLGALPFRDALEVMFSYRDLRAIAILEKLNKTKDSKQEAALLDALYGTPSKLATQGLLTRAKSPRLTIRLEALRAISALQFLSEDVEKALMDDTINNPYTTAYYSARILGSHGIFSSTPLLRELAATSTDYMLAGEAFIALAKLGDHAFRPEIERIVAKTNNPRLKIMGVEALGIYGSPNSLAVLLDILKGSDPPPYLRDEIILAMATILDVQNQFYPLLVRFLADESLVPALAMDEAESAYEHYASLHSRKRLRKDPDLAELHEQAKVFQDAISSFIKESKGDSLTRWILKIPDDFCHAVVQTVLSEAILDDEFLDHKQLRLLIVHWAARELRIWANRLKNRR